VERATPADADQLADVFLASRRDALPYLPELHSDGDTHRWMREVVLARCAVWVAREGAAPVGFLALEGEHVEHLYVAPAHQGRGIGSRLLDQAKAASPARLELYAFQRNAAARSFYERRGFRPVRFGDGSTNEEHEPDVLYEWMPE
jgi:GNAT superfamily N-acetyltransferase